MPCDTITTQSVNLAKAVPSVLINALKADGWNVSAQNTQTEIKAYHPTHYASLTWTAGKGLEVRARAPQEHIGRVTKAYSAQAVSWAAQRAGWTVTQNSPNTLTASRR